MKTFTFTVAVGLLFLGIGGFEMFYTKEFPIPGTPLTTQDNLTFTLICAALGIWGLLALIINEIKEKV